MSGYSPPDKPEKLILSPEETQTLKKCLDGTFLTHSVPVAIGGFSVMMMSKKLGYRPGIWVSSSVVIGCAIMGRLLAVPKCLEFTINQIPDGALATQFNESRERRNKSRNPGFSPAYAPTYESANNAEYSSVEPHLNDEIIDNSHTSTAKPPGQSQQTYEDLRRLNREQYVNSRMARGLPEAQSNQPAGSFAPAQPAPTYSEQSSTFSSYSDPLSPYSERTPLIPPASSAEEEPKVRRRKRVNIYGDEIED